MDIGSSAYPIFLCLKSMMPSWLIDIDLFLPIIGQVAMVGNDTQGCNIIQVAL
jgi:hypothetical protein